MAFVLVAVAKQRSWITPDIWAIRELDQLRNSEAMQASDSELVTENITTILRDYLELQFDIAAPVKTTKELLQVINDGNFMNTATIDQYAEIFDTADLARFAGLCLSRVELTKALDDAQRLIEQTSKGIQTLTPAGEIP
jgi:hypothetical protein